MKWQIKILVFTFIALLTLSGYSKGKKPDKPSKIIKEAVNKTLKQKKLSFRITVGDNKRIVWEGFIVNNKEMRFLGTGVIADEKTGAIVDSEKKRYFYDGAKYYIEIKKDRWEAVKSGKLKNFGAKFLKGEIIKSPFDLFSLIKKYSMDEFEFDKKAENPKGDMIQVIAREDSKKPAKFIEYFSYWKQLKKEEHWKASKITDCSVATHFMIHKKSMKLNNVKFIYEVSFICNYGKGDMRCLGCIDDIGDEIVLEFLDSSKFKLELPDSLKRKLGIKDTAEVKGGLKLTLSVNKNRINKGDTLEFEVKWENVGKKELKIKRTLKTNPYLVFEVEGEIESSKGRFEGESDKKKQYADDSPFKLKAGGKHREIFTMESDGMLSDDAITRVFKPGKFFIKVKTKILDTEEYVESNTIELEIIP